MNKISAIILRNSTIGITAQLLIKVLSFCFSVLVVRRLGAQTFGQYSAVIAFGVAFSFIADLGLSPYAVREVARIRGGVNDLEQIESLFGNVMRIRLILSGITIFLLTGAAWLTGRPLYLLGAIFLNGLGLLLYSVQGASDAVLQGFERLDISALAKIFYQLAFISIGAIVLVIGLGYYGLVIATLISIAVMTVVCWFGLKNLGVRPTKSTSSHWSGLLRSSFPFGVINFALGLSYKFDSILLNIFRTDAETGYYNAAYNLVFTAVVFSNVINTSLYPSLTRQSVSDPGQLIKSYERAIRYLMLIALPIAVGTWALADQLIPFLYTNNYLAAVLALQIIIWVVPWMYLSEFLGYAVLISGHEKKAARAVLVSSGINVLVNLWVVPHYGYIGAAVMTVATEMILVAQYVWFLRSVLRQINWFDNLLRPIIAAGLMGLLCVWMHSVGVPFLLNASISGLFYLVLVFLLRIMGRNELSLLKDIRLRPQKGTVEP